MADRATLAAALTDRNVQAFLRVIRAGESSQGDEAYHTVVGGGRVGSLADHPRQRVFIKSLNLWSTAAGAYQFLQGTWDECAAALGLRDFEPPSQDLAAVFLIDRRGALADVLAGRIEAAIARCAKEWASLPGSPYGQPTRTLAQALATYREFGGVLRQADAPAPIETRDLPKEAPMSASDVINSPLTRFALAAINPILGLVPEIAKIFMDKEGTTVPERNVAAAIKVVGAAQDALNKAGIPAQNAQGVAEAIESNPEARTVVREAIMSKYFELTEAGGGGLDGARKADALAMSNAGPVWQVLKSPSFVVACLLLPLVYLIVLSIIGVVGSASWSDDVRAAIAGTIVGSIVGGLVGYYYGQTTSRNRTA